MLKNWIIGMLLLCVFSLGTYVTAKRAYEVGVEAGMKIGFTLGYQQAVAEQKSGLVTKFTQIISECESGGKHTGVYGRQGEYGVVQFKRATFDWMKKLANMPDLKWTSREDQLTLLGWAIEHGRAQQHWKRCFAKAAAAVTNDVVQWANQPKSNFTAVAWSS